MTDVGLLTDCPNFLYICGMKEVDSADYIKALITEGEHVNQDFKFEISDARKIAKSLSAFSNTSGGRLLIGVKDNGKIAGVRSDEEAYMIEAAADVYCVPKPEVEMKVYIVDGKTVLVAEVMEAENKPVCALDEDGKNRAYIRIADENILATPVHMNIWKQEKSCCGSLVQLSGAEQMLMDMLHDGMMIDIKSFSKRAAISRFKAVKILAKFVRFGVLEEVFNGHKFYWKESGNRIDIE